MPPTQVEPFPVAPLCPSASICLQSTVISMQPCRYYFVDSVPGRRALLPLLRVPSMCYNPTLLCTTNYASHSFTLPHGKLTAPRILRRNTFLPGQQMPLLPPHQSRTNFGGGTDCSGVLCCSSLLQSGMSGALLSLLFWTKMCAISEKADCLELQSSETDCSDGVPTGGDENGVADSTLVEFSTLPSLWGSAHAGMS